MKKISLKILIGLVMATVFSAKAQINWQNNPVGAVFAREGGETPAGTFRLISEGIEVFTIVSAAQTEFYQPSSLFYGDNDINKATVDALAPSGKVASSMNCFLVRKDGHNFLIDTGLPPERGGMIMERLKSLNIDPESIEAVFITHGHFDHIGGLINGDGSPNFPKASIYVEAKELTWMESSNAEFTSKLKNAYGDKVIVFQPGELLPHEMLPIAAYGHTPGHVVYRLGNLLFAGDILHGMSVQLIDPSICANFDMDKELAVKTREDILKYAASNSLTVLCAHVPNNGVLF